MTARRPDGAPGDAPLAGTTWTEAGDRADAVLVVPLGATEQHGPHLPMDVDTRIAAALAGALAAARPRLVLAPALPYGASGEHRDFPGTLSIGTAALEHVLVELGRSASGSFAGLLLVSGHGGNRDAVVAAVARLRDEGRDVRALGPRFGGDAHAGAVETSLMLHLRPAAVRTDRLAPGATAPIDELEQRLRREGVRAVSPSGVLGDPTGATAAEGRRLLAAATAEALGRVDAWWPAGPRTAGTAPTRPTAGARA